MKKRLGAFLALLLITCMALPWFSQTAQAAGPTLSVDFRRALAANLQSYIPTPTVEQNGPTQAQVSWKLMDTNSETMPIGGHFWLRYVIANDKLITVEVEVKSKSQLLVNYNVSKIDGTAPVADPAFGVYNYQNGGRYDAFTSHPLRKSSTTTNFYVDDDASVDYPSFSLTQDTGFTFQFDSCNVSILWVAAENEFRLATTGVQQGFVYDFDLHYTTGGVTLPVYTDSSQPYHVETRTILNGLQQSLITSETFAHGMDSDTADAAKVKLADVLNWVTAGSGNLDQAPPAKPENGFDLAFELPKMLVGTDYIATSTTDLQTKLGTLNARVQFTGSPRPTGGTGVVYAVDLNNILGAVSATPSTSSYSASAARVGNKITLTVSKLPAGDLFQDITISLTTNKAGVQLRTTERPNYSLHTFLDYEIVYQGGRFCLILSPYKTASGYYMLLESNPPKEAVIMYSDGKSKLTIPLNLNAADEQDRLYQIAFSPNNPFPDDQYNPSNDSIILSQKMNYKASKDKASLGVPGNFEIVDSLLQHPIPSSSIQPGKLSMTLRWNISDTSEFNSILDSKTGTPTSITLQYDLRRTLSPSAAPAASDVFAKLLVTITRSGAVGSYKYAAKYSIIDAALGVTIAEGWDTIADMSLASADGRYNSMYTDPASSKTMLRGYVTLETTASQMLPAAPDEKFYFPNVYFISISPKAVTYHTGAAPTVDADNPYTTNGYTATPNLESLYDTLTLDDMASLEPPAPQNATLSNPLLTPDSGTPPKSVASMELSWLLSGARISEYVRGMFEHETHTFVQNVYISQNEAELKKVLAKDAADRQTGLAAWDFDTSAPGYTAGVAGSAPVLDFALMQADDNGTPVNAIDYLRSDKVLLLNDIELDAATLTGIIDNGTSVQIYYKLNGLDKNQTYYVAVDLAFTFVTPKLTTPPSPLPITEHVYLSKLTGIVAETTPKEATEPKPDEISPPAPDLNKQDIGLSSATVYWDLIPDVTNTANDAVTEYEVIRVKDAPLATQLLDTKIAFPAFYNTHVTAANKLGFKTSRTPIGIYEWTGSGFASAVSPITRLEYKPDTQARFVDKTLLPNSLYFYYVRTVRTSSTGVSYSTWSVISVTTAPVQPPVNLDIVRYGVTYDPKHEMVIVFDAPIPSLAGLDTAYEMQVSLKKGGEPWSAAVKLTATQLLSATRTPDMPDHYRLTYRITGLAHGTVYGVRVRIRDLIQNDESIYSNIAETRTDFDQADYDSNKEENDWIGHMNEMLAALLRDEYWNGSTGDTFVAVYRPTMWNRVMNRSTDANLTLAETNLPKAEYYIPASALLAANAANKSFVFKHGNTEVVLSPNMLNPNTNSALQSAALRIKNKNAEDYFVKINIQWTPVGKTASGSSILINGATPITDEVYITMQAVTSKRDLKAWDGSMLLYMSEYLASSSHAASLEATVKNWRAGKLTNEEMLRAAENVLATIDANVLRTRVRSELSGLRDTDFSVTALSSPLLIKLTDSAAYASNIVDGYRRIQGSTWSKLTLIQLGQLKTISTTALGAYAFTKVSVSLPGIYDLPGGADLQQLILQYGLEDYLGKGANFNMAAKLSTYDVAGVMARLAGAPRTADPVAWLRTRGYTAFNTRAGAMATNQESIYLLMAMYEIRTGTKADTIKIRNYSLTANIRLDARFMKSVQAAYELGLCTNRNMQPTAAPTVKELLEMLSALQGKIKL